MESPSVGTLSWVAYLRHLHHKHKELLTELAGYEAWILCNRVYVRLLYSNVFISQSTYTVNFLSDKWDLLGDI